TNTIPRPRADGGAIYGMEPNIKSLQCPSAPSPTAYKTRFMFSPQWNQQATADPSPANEIYGFMDYYPNRGFIFSSAPGAIMLGVSNYVAVGGYPWFAATSTDTGGQFKGVFYFGSQTKMLDITDGTSNTLFFGEYANNWVDFGTGNALTGPCAATWAAS